MASVTIDSVTDGAKVEITIEEVGNDAAAILVKTWAKGSTPGAKPKKTDLVELYSVFQVKNQDAITCFAKAPGPDPTVTCTLNAGSGANERSVRLMVKGSLFGAGDRDETHSISDPEYQAVMGFLAKAAFPVK
jgi:hypothetical protein